MQLFVGYMLQIIIKNSFFLSIEHGKKIADRTDFAVERRTCLICNSDLGGETKLKGEQSIKCEASSKRTCGTHHLSISMQETPFYSYVHSRKFSPFTCKNRKNRFEKIPPSVLFSILDIVQGEALSIIERWVVQPHHLIIAVRDRYVQ